MIRLICYDFMCFELILFNIDIVEGKTVSPATVSVPHAVCFVQTDV